MRNGILLALLVGILPLCALAEGEPPPPQSQINNTEVQDDPPLGLFTFLTKIPGDYVAVAKSIFARDQLVPWLSVAGSTAALIKYDYELWQPFSKEHAKKGFAYDASEFGWNVGKGGFQFAIAGGFLLYGASFKSHRALRTTSQILEVVIATGITTQVLKHMIGRESPNVAIHPRTGKWQWFPNPAKYARRVSAYDAFPSGHIATTLATTRVIMLNFPEHKWIPYVGYPIVAYVGVSMVATNGHWWSDYPLSILLGYHFAKAVTRGNAPQKPELETDLRLDPYMPYPQSAGVMLSKRF